MNVKARVVIARYSAATAGRIWVENRVDFSDARNLITVAVALVLGAAVAVLLLFALIAVVVGASRLVERRYAQMFG